jgi:hypothetical protein
MFRGGSGAVKGAPILTVLPAPDNSGMAEMPDLQGFFRNTALWLNLHWLTTTISKSALVAAQCGQVQSAGTSSQRVPGAMPSSGMPSASSYTNPHRIQSHFLSFMRASVLLFLALREQCVKLAFEGVVVEIIVKVIACLHQLDDIFLVTIFA